VTVAVVVVAAGSGDRLAVGQPKALVPLHGRPMVEWSVQAFRDHPGVGPIVVVAPEQSVEPLARNLAGSGYVVAGGPTRQRSVERGLAALPSDVRFVLVHDAARPFVSAGVISAVLDRLHAGAKAVIPVLPVVDTIKRVDDVGNVVETVDRTELRSVQTPQGFDRQLLASAHRDARQNGVENVTDDAGLMEGLGHVVATVAGSQRTFKITTPADLDLAERLAAE
jgi:2-C-methyl-D-erythritol 4-phosphate cytidylyltransferase